MIQQAQGNYGEAVRLYEASLKIAEELGDKAGVARSLHQLGMIQQDQGNYGEAVRLYEESLKVFEELGDKAGVATSLHQLGNVQYLQGNYGEAVRLYEASLRIKEELGDKAGVASSFGQLGKLAQAQGRHKEAAGYYLRALALFRALNSPYALLAMRDLASVRREVGVARFAAWWDELCTRFSLDLGGLTPDDLVSEEVEQGVAPQEAQLLAGLAQSVAEALRSEDEAAREKLAGQLETLAAQVPPKQEGLHRLLGVLQGMLRGEDVTAQAAALCGAYRGTYEAVQALATGEMREEPEGDQGEGTALDRVLDKIVNDTIFVMTQGNPAQRGQLWEALGQLRLQVVGQAELSGFAAFLDAVRQLLEGRRKPQVELEPPFDEAWRKIVEGCGDNRG